MRLKHQRNIQRLCQCVTRRSLVCLVLFSVIIGTNGLTRNDGKVSVVRDYQRRSSCEYLRKTQLPNSQGYVNVYVRESSNYNRRYPFKRTRFPYVYYQQKRFVFDHSLIRVTSWLPIYVQRATGQTFIYSPEGVYILPPLINYYGKAFPIAGLIASGYASLINNGVAPPPPSFNIGNVVQPVIYFTTNVPGFNLRTGRFMNGVKTNYRSNFRKPYLPFPVDHTIEEYPRTNEDDICELPKRISNTSRRNFSRSRSKSSNKPPVITPSTSAPPITESIKSILAVSPNTSPIEPITPTTPTTGITTTSSSIPTGITMIIDEIELEDDTIEFIIITTTPSTADSTASITNPTTTAATTSSTAAVPGTTASTTSTTTTATGSTSATTTVTTTVGGSTSVTASDTTTVATSSRTTMPSETTTVTAKTDTSQGAATTESAITQKSLSVTIGTTTEDITATTGRLIANTIATTIASMDATTADMNASAIDTGSMILSRSRHRPPENESLTEETKFTTETPSLSMTNASAAIKCENVLSWYNVITLENLSTSSNIENRTIVCGSLISSATSSYGTQIDISTFPEWSYSLEVFGDIVPGAALNISAGSVSISSDPKHVITKTNDENYLVDGRPICIYGGWKQSRVHAEENLEMKCELIKANSQELCNHLANHSTLDQNTVDIPTTTDSNLLIFHINTVDTNGFAVFTLSADQILNNPLIEQIEIQSTVPNLELVIINLSGTNLTLNHGTFQGDWLTSINGRARTIWNFYEAISIIINQNWMGTLLAPTAIVSTDHIIQGVVIVQSLNTTNTVQDAFQYIPQHQCV